MSATTHCEITLELNADVAEWCPLPGRRRLLAAGTYQLDEPTGQRHGRMYMYRLDGDIDGLPQGPRLQLQQLASVDLPGIFDLRWHPLRPVIAVALADGSVRVLQVGNDREEGTSGANGVAELASSNPLDASMALSLDFSPAPGGGTSIVSSFSCGSLRHFQATPSALVPLSAWRAHSLEAWAAAWDPWNPHVVYSGGDDSALKVWDLRQAQRAQQEGGRPATAAWADGKSHGAGVCCVAGSPHEEGVLCTGSYDEQARLWDARQLARPVARAQAGAGGGVWRLKWHPADPQLLLAACMHAGFGVLHVEAAEGKVSLAERYPGQRTLAYGAGWCSEVGGGGASVAATCSFYDSLLHVWSPATLAAAPPVQQHG